MQVQATPHPPARTRPLAAVLDGPNADPFGPHEPAPYAAARGGVAARASDAAITSRRARQRRTATAGPLATPAGYAVAAPMDVPLAAHPPVMGVYAVGPYRREGLWRRSPVGRAAAGVIRGWRRDTRPRAGRAGHSRLAGRIVRHA